MTFTPLPKTGRDWELTCVRSNICAGSALLIAQIWARTFLTGWMRQHIEELLWPFPLFLRALLLCCSVVAFLRRERMLGTTAALIGVVSVWIALLPFLLGEGIID